MEVGPLPNDPLRASPNLVLCSLHSGAVVPPVLSEAMLAAQGQGHTNTHEDLLGHPCLGFLPHPHTPRSHKTPQVWAGGSTKHGPELQEEKGKKDEATEEGRPSVQLEVLSC